MKNIEKKYVEELHVIFLIQLKTFCAPDRFIVKQYFDQPAFMVSSLNITKGKETPGIKTGIFNI